eukprot:scaffold67489_cov28-Tisochrysis_lutea.AAC.2
MAPRAPLLQLQSQGVARGQFDFHASRCEGLRFRRHGGWAPTVLGVALAIWSAHQILLEGSREAAHQVARSHQPLR